MPIIPVINTLIQKVKYVGANGSDHDFDTLVTETVNVLAICCSSVVVLWLRCDVVSIYKYCSSKCRDSL